MPYSVSIASSIACTSTPSRRSKRVLVPSGLAKSVPCGPLRAVIASDNSTLIPYFSRRLSMRLNAMVYTGLYSADIFLLSLADDLQNHSTDSIHHQIDLSGPPAF